MDSCFHCDCLVADFLAVVTVYSDIEPGFEGPYIARRSVVDNPVEVDGYTGKEKHWDIGL
jgi:hypothetical protein